MTVNTTMLVITCWSPWRPCRMVPVHQTTFMYLLRITLDLLGEQHWEGFNQSHHWSPGRGPHWKRKLYNSLQEYHQCLWYLQWCHTKDGRSRGKGTDCSCIRYEEGELWNGIGSHIVIDSKYTPKGRGLINQSSDGRVCFMLPWLGEYVFLSCNTSTSTMVGTTDHPGEITMRPPNTQEDIDFILNECNKYVPSVCDDEVGCWMWSWPMTISSRSSRVSVPWSKILMYGWWSGTESSRLRTPLNWYVRIW